MHLRIPLENKSNDNQPIERASPAVEPPPEIEPTTRGAAVCLAAGAGGLVVLALIAILIFKGN